MRNTAAGSSGLVAAAALWKGAPTVLTAHCAAAKPKHTECTFCFCCHTMLLPFFTLVATTKKSDYSMILSKTVLARIVLDKICLIFLYSTFVKWITDTAIHYLGRAPCVYGWLDT
jgi:hypothetical protein